MRRDSARLRALHRVPVAANPSVVAVLVLPVAHVQRPAPSVSGTRLWDSLPGVTLQKPGRCSMQVCSAILGRRRHVVAGGSPLSLRTCIIGILVFDKEPVDRTLRVQPVTSVVHPRGPYGPISESSPPTRLGPCFLIVKHCDRYRLERVE